MLVIHELQERSALRRVMVSDMGKVFLSGL